MPPLKSEVAFLKLVEARGGKKKTCHAGEEEKISEWQALLPQKMPPICIPHKNILFSSIIIGKQVMKNLNIQDQKEAIEKMMVKEVCEK